MNDEFTRTVQIDDYEYTLKRNRLGQWTAEARSWLDNEETDEWPSPEGAIKAIADATGMGHWDLLREFGLTN